MENVLRSWAIGLLQLLYRLSCHAARSVSHVGRILNNILYINLFQIVPEERVLTSLFGPDFIDYKSRARRWL
jgi:protein-S-isoprenylcysteine O-methyltransferase Ste14